MSGVVRVGFGVVLLSLVASASACGGKSEDRESSGNSNGGRGATSSGGSEAGGTSANGGTSGSTGPTGGAANGGAASGGTSGGMNSDPECAEISRDMPCELEGKQCPALPCGLANAGRRDCFCATTWMCTQCGGLDPPPPPGPFEACPPDATEGAPCFTDGTVCGPIGSEYCACSADAEGELVWACGELPEGAR